MKIPSIIIIWTEVEEESHLKNPGNIIHKIIQENFPNLKKDTPIKVQEAYRTSNRLEEEKKVPWQCSNQNTNHAVQRNDF